jgi:predicted secreted Zn-dependent protease
MVMACGASGSATSAAQGASVHTANPCASGTFPHPGALRLARDGVTERHDPPRYYDVYGHRAAEVNAQMDRCTPTPPWRGEARWYFNYTFAYSPAGGGCAMTHVSVGIHTAVSLPRWSASAGDAPGLADAWRAFSSGLMTHERGHVTRADAWARTMLADLEALTGSCDAMVGLAATRFADDLAAANRAEVDYDARTQHGVTQGAVLR